MKRICLVLLGLLLLAAPTAQAQFNYAASNGSVTILEYTGSSRAMIIPSRIDNLPVTTIGNGLISVLTGETGASSVTSIVIPNSVTSIGDSAFSQGTSMTNIVIPNSVTTIGDEAFFDCTNLTSIVIPNSVTSIGDSTFDYCLSLSRVLIPDSVTNIGDSAFTQCDSLNSIRIPNSVTSIGNFAFQYSGLSGGITIPDSVTSIGDSAFDQCFLTSVAIGAGVTNIGDSAFSGIYWLTNVTFSGSATRIGNEAFFDCIHLASVTIPNNVASIGDDAFATCIALTNVTIGTGVTNIGVDPFGECFTLATISVAGQNAFYSSGNGVLFDKSQTTLVEFPDGIGGSYSIPQSVTAEGEGAFAFCTNLTNVTIPGSVKNIGTNAFEYCPGLRTITVDAANLVYSSLDGVLFNKRQTTLIQYPAGNAGAYYTIPSDVTAIADSAFEFSSVREITIPNSVTSIGSNAFNYCLGLDSVTIPSSVTNIGDAAFFMCNGLHSATIGNGVVSIGDETFNDCANMTSVTLGNSVTSIGIDAFAGCVGLTSIIIPSSVTNIGEGAFDKCSSLVSVAIPDGVTSIGDYMFGFCQKLTTISLPNSITNIGEGAFYDCGDLSSITIPNGVTSIGEDAFFICTNLSSITIPKSVASLGDEAFGDCASLAGVYFQSNAPLFGHDVFDSDNIAKIYYLPGTSGWDRYFTNVILNTEVPEVILNPPNPAGSLQVTIVPAAAISAGAQWQVDGGLPQPSGAKVLGLTVGNHVLSFNAVGVGTRPVSQTVRISANNTTMADGIYEEMGNPIFTIAFPKPGQSVSNSLLLAAGAVEDNVAVDGVYYQLNGGAWTVATPSNSWSNWTASSVLHPGANTFSAYAQDSSGSSSRTNTVVFNYNVFLASQGTYNGLFAPTNGPRHQTNSGAFTFTLTSTGSVSGKLTIGSNTPSLNGQFNTAGALTIATVGKDESSLTTTLQLDFTNQSVSGTVSDGSFIANLNGDRDVFSSSSKATRFEGQYTLVIPGVNDPTMGPYGTSYGTVAVDDLGNIKLAGSLADGTAISQSSVVSQSGAWPFYVSLYGGQGSLWGSNYFSSHSLTNGSALSWINATNASKTAVYRAGFTNPAATLTGGLYVATNTLSPGLAVTLQDSLFAVTVTSLPKNTNKLTLQTNKMTGVINGSFANPANPKQTIKVSGVILQLQGKTNAQGYFLGTNQSGIFTLGPP